MATNLTSSIRLFNTSNKDISVLKRVRIRPGQTVDLFAATDLSESVVIDALRVGGSLYNQIYVDRTLSLVEINLLSYANFSSSADDLLEAVENGTLEEYLGLGPIAYISDELVADSGRIIRESTDGYSLVLDDADDTDLSFGRFKKYANTVWDYYSVGTSFDRIFKLDHRFLIFLSTSTGTPSICDRYQTVSLGGIPNTAINCAVSDGYVCALGAGPNGGIKIFLNDQIETIITALADAPGTQYWSGMAQTDGYWVAVSSVSSSNKVAVSSDGITWNAVASGLDQSWQAVVYGDELFVAVASSGSGNRVMTSPDGTTWTSRTSAADNNWVSIAYGAGTYVAVSSDGYDRVMTSADGISWSAQTLSKDYNFTGVVYDGYYFVASARNGSYSGNVIQSLDGINWISCGDSSKFRITPINAATNDSAYGNDVFVAGGTYITVSADGIGWDVAYVPATTVTGCAYGNGLFVCVSDSTSTLSSVYISSDGLTWTVSTSAAANTWKSVTYGAGLFVAVSSTGSGNRVMTSTDGITWASRTSAANNTWNSVTYGNNLFVAVASTGSTNRIMTSPDGITWTSRTSIDQLWISVAYGAGLFVALASTGHTMTSVDGITWVSGISLLSTASYSTIRYINNAFVALRPLAATGASVAMSADGVNWTYSSFQQNFTAIAYGQSKYVVFNVYSNAYSTNLTNWTFTGKPYEGFLCIARGVDTTTMLSTTGYLYFNRAF